MNSEETTSTAPSSAGGLKDKFKFIAHGDRYIWSIYIMLCIVSIIEQYSASARIISSTDILGPIVSHCIHLLMGLVVIVVLQRIHYSKFFENQGSSWNRMPLLRILFCFSNFS